MGQLRNAQKEKSLYRKNNSSQKGRILIWQNFEGAADFLAPSLPPPRVATPDDSFSMLMPLEKAPDSKNSINFGC